jgi:hypothetical protein
MAPAAPTTQGNDMKKLQWLAVTAGIAALAACSGGDEANTTNAEITAEDNLALPPADMNADLNADMNADLNADLNADTNATNNTADNTTNAY